MAPKPPIPFPNSYWVLPGQLLAGEHPTLLDPVGNCQRIDGLIRAKITVFLDLTELDETADLESYMALLAERAPQHARQCQYHRVTIPDMTAPSVAEMVSLLDIVDTALASDQRVYVHCWGGIGRTGTVVGCYLVRHGWTGQAAIAHLAELRAGTPDARYAAPARDGQRQMILSWPHDDCRQD